MKRPKILIMQRALRAIEAAAYLSLSETKFRQLVSDGRIARPKRIDGVVTWDIRDLDSFYDDLPREDELAASDWDGVAL